MFPEPTRLSIPDCISIGSAVCAQLIAWSSYILYNVRAETRSSRDLNNRFTALVTMSPRTGVNTTGDAADVFSAIFGQPETKCPISPKVCQIVIKLPAELMRTVTTVQLALLAFAVQARQRDSQRETDSPYFCMSCDVIHYALLGCAYTSERQSHISC